MDHADLIRNAFDVFRDDAESPPALSLRGANSVDSYESPEPFDEADDEPTDEYLERFAFWAMPYLDARSWRHYLPRLIEYSLGHLVDPAMVTEALVRSLRPPDRVPARLATLSDAQERVIVAFLELLALDDAGTERSDAAEALQEWWHPGAHLRTETSARPKPISQHARVVVRGSAYRLEVPEIFIGGGVHPSPAEERTMEQWNATIDRDAVAQLIVNVQPLRVRSLAVAEEEIARWMNAESAEWIEVPGARMARRLDAPSFRYSPGEPERTTVVLAATHLDLVSLTVRATDRADVIAEMDRIIRSFEVMDALEA